MFEFKEYADNLDGLKNSRPIQITGEVRTGSYIPNSVTSNIKTAISGVDAILVAIQAPAIERLAHLLAECIEENQYVYLFPGYASSISLNKIWTEEYNLPLIKCAEVMTLPYACRKTSGDSVKIYRRTGKLGLASFPGKYLDEMFTFFQTMFEDSYKFGNILEMALCNQNIIIHPVVTLLSATRIEIADGEFDFYTEGCTPSTESVIDALDQEIFCVFKAVNFINMSSKDACEIRFGMTWEQIQKTRKSWNLTGLKRLDSRYITEDVPDGLVLLSSMGRQFSVPTPTSDALIHLWEIINNDDYWAKGRTMEKLGLAKMSIEEFP